MNGFAQMRAVLDGTSRISRYKTGVVADIKRCDVKAERLQIVKLGIAGQIERRQIVIAVDAKVGKPGVVPYVK